MPAPYWALLAVGIRSAATSFLWYLPQHLAGRTPIPIPYLNLVPPDRYYLFLVWFTPADYFLVWLLGGALTWFVFRLGRRDVGLGAILNICGMASLVSGTALLLFDLIARAANWELSRTLWGLLHLVLDFWYYAITITGFRRILRIPIWLAVVAVVVMFAVGVPIAMLFMRA